MEPPLVVKDMAYILSIQDFKGEIAISNNEFTKPNLQWYIDEFEKKYLKKILGIKLYNEFINDLINGEPQKLKFKKLLEGDVYEACGSTHDYEGLKNAIKYFVWCEYVRDGNNFNTIGGMVRTENENSRSHTRVSLAPTLEKRYNDGIYYSKQLAEYLKEFERKKSKKNTIINHGTLTNYVEMSDADTTYLEPGDEVIINREKYIVEVVTNEYFSIETLKKIDGKNKYIEWEVFGKNNEKGIKSLTERSFFNGSV